MKKNNKIILNCTTEFKQKIIEKAKQCEMNLTSYCIFILRKATPKIEILD